MAPRKKTEEQRAAIIAAIAASPAGALTNRALSGGLGVTFSNMMRVTRDMEREGLLRYSPLGWTIPTNKVEPEPTPEPVPAPEPEPTPDPEPTIDPPAPEPEPTPEPSASNLGLPPRAVKAADPCAFYGLAGDFVNLVSSESEADPHALLLEFLVIFGAMVGRRSYYLTGATRHFPNEFLVIVGDTAKSRRGSTTDTVLDIFKDIDEPFMDAHIFRSLASAPGLIYRIRDPEIVDKRLIVLETEFASILGSSEISLLLRNCFDAIPLQRGVKQPYGCREPHVCVIGNVTVSELQGKLTKNDRTNGFGNRFLWAWVTREHFEPFGGDPLDETKRKALIDRIKDALKFAQPEKPQRITFTPDIEVRAKWQAQYEGPWAVAAPGVFGAMTSREEAHVARLATIYALLDCSPLIQAPHLDAALALWQYCRDSAAYLFADMLGDPFAELLLKTLRENPEGLRTYP
jgi:hypothetical protein